MYIAFGRIDLPDGKRLTSIGYIGRVHCTDYLWGYDEAATASENLATLLCDSMSDKNTMECGR
ncbi:hypothetical protein KSD_30150 [Ktedonobacter sp. SOSP1-85]|nr:hypothetical protein KSD_30150 [Ktedonobacter sp. SOSP1-85]